MTTEHQIPADIRLDRGEADAFLATAQAWGAVLHLAEDYGWEPEHKPHLYLADVGLLVSEEDANALADAVQEAVDDIGEAEAEDDADASGLLHPLEALTENADRLRELVTFCRRGAFTIR